MSRQLPEKPHFEYLKKQAKELLRSMRQGKLADAQHTLANEYGFATWAKLKSMAEGARIATRELWKKAARPAPSRKIVPRKAAKAKAGRKR